MMFTSFGIDFGATSLPLQSSARSASRGPQALPSRRRWSRWWRRRGQHRRQKTFRKGRCYQKRDNQHQREQADLYQCRHEYRRACFVSFFLLLIIPLLVTPALPKSFLATMLTAPPPPAAPPRLLRQRCGPREADRALDLKRANSLAPKSIPKDVNIIKEDAPPPDVGVSQVTGGVVGGVPGGQIGGVLGGIIGGVSTAAPPPPPPPAAPVSKVSRGGDVMMASAISKVTPNYPPLARQNHIQGTVRLHTLIDKDGKVIEVTYVSGPPMLFRPPRTP